jgi:hypothetical protein
MAIDTQLKRASSAQLMLFFIHTPQFPTGTFTVFVRQAVAHVYSGISAAFSGASILIQMMLHHGG